LFFSPWFLITILTAEVVFWFLGWLDSKKEENKKKEDNDNKVLLYSFIWFFLFSFSVFHSAMIGCLFLVRSVAKAKRFSSRAQNEEKEEES
jgi:hypothetical protein